MRFQIAFTDSQGCGHFKYVDGETEAEAKRRATIAANEDLKQQYDRSFHSVFAAFTPIKTLTVREIVKRETPRPHWINKRGGIRFKLRLRFFEATFDDGSKKKAKWYEADED